MTAKAFQPVDSAERSCHTFPFQGMIGQDMARPTAHLKGQLSPFLSIIEGRFW